MLFRIVFLIVLFLSVSAFAQTESEVLSIGRSVEWAVSSRSPITLSNGAVLRAKDLGQKIKITAKKLGTGVVRTGSRSLEITVVPEASYRLYKRLSDSLGERRGLRLNPNDRSLTVEGRLLRMDDWIALAQASIGSSYRFDAFVIPEIQPQALKHFQKLSRDSQLPELSIELVPQATITIPSEPADLKERVAKVFGPYGFKIETSSSALSLEPLVQVRIVVAEVRRSHMSKVGIEWPPSGSAQLLPRLGLEQDLMVGIHALESNGVMKLLASPTLLCRSGKEAEFVAGGEFPIKVGNHKVQGVIWKKYGIVLKIKPRADLAGRMSIAVETEVSMIDASRTVDGVPGLLTNRIQSHFDLASSRTIAISGLIKKEWGDAVAGLPGLSQVPVLGALFGSRDYREDQTELIVFVTPEISRSEKESP